MGSKEKTVKVKERCEREEDQRMEEVRRQKVKDRKRQQGGDAQREGEDKSMKGETGDTSTKEMKGSVWRKEKTERMKRLIRAARGCEEDTRVIPGNWKW